MSDHDSDTVARLEHLVGEGEAAFGEGDLERAEGCFRRVLRADGSHGVALNDLGVLLHTQGQLEEAEQLFLKAALFSADPSGPLVNLSMIAQAQSRFTEAVRYLDRALALCGETAEISAQVVQLKAAMGLAEPVVTEYRGALQTFDLTPDLEHREVALQGYFAPPRMATAVISPLSMQVLLLEDAAGNRLLLVAADIFGFGPEMVQVIRHAAAEWGVPAERVMLNASHTHYGPGTVTHAVPGLGTFDHEFALDLCHKVAAALPVLYQALAPCTLSATMAEAQIGFHRRVVQAGQVQMLPNPEGHYEVATPVLAVDFAGTGERLVLVNHGCHPTGLGGADTICSDYPGRMRTALVEQGAAHHVMFLQGAAGDSKQATVLGDRARWTSEFSGVEQNGEILAKAVIDALSGTLTAVNGPIRSASTEVVLPVRPGPQGRAALDDPRNAGIHEAMLTNWAAAATRRYEQVIGGYAIDLQVVSVGQAVFNCIPGEPMAATARTLRAQEGAVHFVLGYTNGLAAYFPTDEMVRQGGYEGHMSAFVYVLPAPLGAGTEDKVIQAVRGLRHEIERSVADPIREAPPTDHAAFFVLSTGRSGTQTLAHLFELADNAKVWHHPEPNLIEETLHAYWGQLDTRQVFWAGRGGIIRQAWDAALIHGETDHNMTPFADVIAEDIPDARFLVLVRDPREFVRSGMRRGYYHPQAKGPWEAARLRPEVTDPDWEARDRLSKVSWLWAETYRHVERLRASIGEDRVMVLRFEDLIAGPDTTRALFDFLGLAGYDEDRVRAILGQKLNAQKHGEFPHPRDWSPEMHAACWAEVGPIAGLYGYPEVYTR
jgi:neutral ceramidase